MLDSLYSAVSLITSQIYFLVFETPNCSMLFLIKIAQNCMQVKFLFHFRSLDNKGEKMKRIVNIIVIIIFFAALLASMTSNQYTSYSGEISSISPSIPIPNSSSSDLAVDEQTDTELAAVDVAND